jgi:hypothetical protein
MNVSSTPLEDRYSLFRRLFTLVPVLCFFVFGSPVFGGEEVTIDGVLHVKNPAVPPDGLETLELEELWRAGGDDEGVFFGLITQVISDDEGNVYLLDTQLSEVPVFGPDGQLLRTLSRQGEGPGESNRPVDMLFMSDGAIGLVQSFPGKIVKVTKSGEPAGTFMVGGGDPTQGGFALFLDAKQAAGNLVIGGMRIAVNQAEGSQTRTNFLASFGDDGAEKVRYLELDQKMDFANLKIDEKNQYFVHFRHWALGPDGRVYTAPHRNEYTIVVFNADGTKDRVIEREFESWKRTEKDMARVNSIAEAQQRQSPIEFEVNLCDTEPDISSLRIASDGSLWVLNSRSTREQPDGVMATYDVFDANGYFVKQVSVKCQGDGQEDGLIFIGDDRILHVTGFLDAVVALQGGSPAEDEGEEPEPMEAICYRIK